MKKYILLLLVATLFLRIEPVSATAMIYVSPSSLNKDSNETFTVTIMISGATNLYGYEFKISYNNTVLTAVSIAKGTLLPDKYSMVWKNNINQSLGRIWFICTLINPGTPQNGSGSLAVITFKTSLAGGVSSLHLYDVKLGDEGGNPLSYTTNDGFVSVAKFDWNGWWQTFNNYVYWDLEWHNGINWESRKTDLKLSKKYPQSNKCKLTFNFTCSEAGDYRIILEIRQAVQRYVNKTGSYQYILIYSGYNVTFDWSDAISIPGITFSHGIKNSYFWFRISRTSVPRNFNLLIDPSFTVNIGESTSSSTDDNSGDNSSSSPGVSSSSKSVYSEWFIVTLQDMSEHVSFSFVQELPFFVLSRNISANILIWNITMSGFVEYSWWVLDSQGKRVLNGSDAFISIIGETWNPKVSFTLPEGDYTFYFEIDSLDNESPTNPIVLEQTFAVGNIYLSFVFQYIYHMILVFAILLAILCAYLLKK